MGFFAFFYILYKRMWRSLRSFTFFIKERCALFGFISHTKMTNLAKKERKRTVRSFLGLKKNLKFFFAIYITRVGHAFFYVLLKTKAAFFAFFYVLYKRMWGSLHSLRSFTFFIKERGVLCVLLHSL